MAMWRLGINSDITTVFCTDAKTAGDQATGKIGANEPDQSHRLLRALFQALEAALPTGCLQLHHMNSHTGEILNELADSIAKREAKQSFNIPHQQLNLQKWMPKFLQLWTLFGQRYGLPTWYDGFLDANAPDLQSPAMTLSTSTDVQYQTCAMSYALSMATANVQSLSRGPEGHGGNCTTSSSKCEHIESTSW